jgi:hypothetical protein
MTEYDRREGLPGANYAQFCLDLLAFVASHPALRAASRSEQISAWMADSCRRRLATARGQNFRLAQAFWPPLDLACEARANTQAPRLGDIRAINGRD